MTSSLSGLLKGVAYQIFGTYQHTIHAIHIHSAQALKKTLFVAIKGSQHDGHDWIKQAIQQGCRVIVLEKMPVSLHPFVTYILVEKTSHVLGLLAANFYGHPSRKLKLVAVTGTNGKTSTVYLLYQLWKSMGYRVGMLSTLYNSIDQSPPLKTYLTTPNSLEIHQLLYQMVQKGCTHCFMEASSHALVQGRLMGLHISGAVFTNISHDHLDYHVTLKAYIQAKKILFDALPSDAFALYNADDPRGRWMVQDTKAYGIHPFSLQKKEIFFAKVLESTYEGMLISIQGHHVWVSFLGKFNAYNLLAVYAVTVLLLKTDEKEKICLYMSKLGPVPGRCQLVLGNAIDFKAFVDYAHTPDALTNVLQTLQKLNIQKKKIITVMGCGGNRDPSKRPLMAMIAQKYSHQIIFTSDNPRDESPEKIISDMQQGITAQAPTPLVVINRKEAIHQACTLAQKGDIVLVAGKGHEKYQEIRGHCFDFDDVWVIQQWKKIF